MKALNIIQGWVAYLSEKRSPLAKERAKHCETCPEAVLGKHEKFMPDNSLKEVQGLKCGLCSCPLSAKLRSVNESCPLNKW